MSHDDLHTFSTLQTFIAAMASNHDVQKRAQAQLDSVVGPGINPERFLENGQLSDTVLDPASIVFGYGRRYAVSSLFSERVPHSRCSK